MTIFIDLEHVVLNGSERAILEDLTLTVSSGDRIGVVGINGIGIFLGKNDNRSSTVAEHIDYVVQLVGIDHAGLGLDYVFDTQELDDFVKANPQMFPAEEDYPAGVKMVAPEQTGEIAAALFRRGYRPAEVKKVLGGNFLRVAKATWPRRPS